MNLFEKPTFRTKKLNSNKTEGTFIISKIARGFGTTIGNSIRRTLISSIESAAPVAVKIKGVKHEFQTISGVEEDAINVILNLKNLVVTIEGNEPAKLILNVSKEGKVTAKNFDSPVNVSIINKTLEIANLEKGANLEMEVIVAKGRGYSRAEENKGYAKEVGYIAMDANFSPINSVNFDVKEINTAKIEMVEEVLLEVVTNGAINAIEAIEQAAAILISHFILFTKLEDLENLNSLIDDSQTQTQEIKSLELTLEELDLSQRSYNALRRAGHEKVSDIAQLTLAQLSDTKNLGRKSIEEVVEKISALGFEIK